MRSQVALAIILLFSVFLSLGTSAQNAPTISVGVTETKRAAIIVQVLTDQHAFLTDQALVRLRSFTGTDLWNVTRYRSEARFDDVAPGSYDIEVSAAGYGTVTQKVEAQGEFGLNRVTVVLKRDGSMPTLTAPPTSGVPKEVRKDTERGIDALKARSFKQSEKYLSKAQKRYPDNADLNYLVGVLYVEKRDLGKAREYLGKSLAADPKHVRSLTTMGRVLLEQKDSAGAIGYLEKAVAADPEQWMAHSLLANGYLRVGEYEKADQAARSALRTGKGSANASRLPLGQALARQGKYPEAIVELEAFVNDVPGSPVVPEVRKLIADLKAAVSEGRTVTAPTMLRAPSIPDLGTSEARLVVPNWGPPSVDDMQPPVARGVTCPEQRVIDGAAERMTELVNSIARFEATEEVIHEDLDEVGRQLARETRKFSYVAEISERERPGMPRIYEYRNAVEGTARFPAGIATLGVPSLAFVFHPKSRDNYDLRCEGLGQWGGQATWLVHFRQRENRPSYLLGYDLGQGVDPVDMKGRAWIVADTFQIVRIEAESIRPMPRIQLLSQHEVVDFGRVTFSDKKVELWLPKKAELYFHFRGHRYYRQHSFDKFRLFGVDAVDKVVAPPK